MGDDKSDEENAGEDLPPLETPPASERTEASSQIEDRNVDLNELKR